MNTDFKISKSIFPVPEVIYEGISEQGIEHDYILPDYYPDIFRLVKCDAVPEIISYSVNDGRLTYELSVDVNFWYCSEKSSELCTVRQKLVYSKTVDTGHDLGGAEIVLCPGLDYINCRVVNQKRTDIKGAVTTRVKIIRERQQEIITSASGMNVQMKKIPVEFIMSRLRAEKSCLISEKLELNQDKPPVKSVIRTEIFPGIPDVRIIAGKLVARGNAQLNILYSCENQDGYSAETMKYTIPYSQIIDMDGLDETYICSASAEAVGCDVTSSGENSFKCEFTINLKCCAVKISHAEIMTDVFSTRYETSFETEKIKLCRPSETINEHMTGSCLIEYPEGEVGKIYDVWCSCSGLTVKTDESGKNVMVSGMIKYSVFMRNSDGMPVLVEKENAYEHKIPVPDSEPGCIPDTRIYTENCSYNLVSGNKISVTAEMAVSGQISEFSEFSAVKEIKIDENEPRKKEGDYAVRLYFGSEGESLWDIAKKYGTSVSAVMEENELSEDGLTGNRMILIPIVN
ncbi:MAG: DUF3794 domain-containing protein [Oscillospiraceae bacterium]|nr:DUF3794 domain-containing protein [Oscillospiraceae bacterium]